MSYLHCHNCGWSQDDFWSKSYNPIRCSLDWEEGLLGNNFSEPFPGDIEWKRINGNLSYKEVIIKDLERQIRKIEKMKWRNMTEFYEDRSKGLVICPNCGCSERFLDID